MQCLKIEISETARSRIGILLFFLNVAVLLVCHAIGAMGLYIKQEVSSISDFLVFYNTSSLFKLLFCVSLLFLVFHLVGAKICYDTAFYETRERFHSLLFYWLLAGCALVALSIAAIIVLTAHQTMVMHAVALGFKQAMKKYKVDREMREYINRIQIEHQCCGATAASDWYRVSWVDTINAAPISHLANSPYMGANGEFLPRWAPFSCCRQNFIGAPCESVWMFFSPRKNPNWVLKSNIYSIDYLSQYDKYSSVFHEVVKASENPPKEDLQRGRQAVEDRRLAFERFLKTVTGHPEVSPPVLKPPPPEEPAEEPPRLQETRALFEARGVRAQSLPAPVLGEKGKPPWAGRIVWNFDNISTAETDNLNQLLRLDGRHEDQMIQLLQWRSFNQNGCAQAIGHNAMITMETASLLFIFILLAQVAILVLARYLQTSVDTAYRWGNPLVTSPGHLLGTYRGQPEDEKRLMEEGESVMESLSEDTGEDGFNVLVSPSWNSGKSEDTTSVETSGLSEDETTVDSSETTELMTSEDETDEACQPDDEQQTLGETDDGFEVVVQPSSSSVPGSQAHSSAVTLVQPSQHWEQEEDPMEVGLRPSAVARSTRHLRARSGAEVQALSAVRPSHHAHMSDWNDVEQGTPETIDKAEMSGKEKMEKLKATGKEKIKELHSHGKEEIEKMKSKGEEKMNKIKSKGKSKIEKLQAKGKDKMEKIKSTGKDNVEKMKTKGKDKMEKLMSSGKKAVKKVEASVKGVGKKKGDKASSHVSGSPNKAKHGSTAKHPEVAKKSSRVSSRSSSPKKYSPENHSVKRKSSKTSSPEKSSHKSRHEKSSPKSSLKKSSPKKHSPKKHSPKKHSPRKHSPKKKSTRKHSPKEKNTKRKKTSSSKKHAKVSKSKKSKGRSSKKKSRK